MQIEALATLVADKFAWEEGDLLIGPHDKLNGLLALAGVDLASLSDGTKRARLKEALLASPDPVRLRIVRTVLEELPPSDSEPEPRQAAREKLKAWANTQEGIVAPSTGSELVVQVLAEFNQLLGDSGAGRAFDRLHSAFCAYLRDLHRSYVGEPGAKSLARLLKAVAGSIPDHLDPDGVAKEVLKAVQRITNTLDQLRNKPAHGQFQLENAELAKDVLASALRFLHTRLGDGRAA